MNNFNLYNVRNVIVNKQKISDFLEFYKNNEILVSCPIMRILPSGAYSIFTFKLTDENQRKEIKKIEQDWV